MSPKKEKKRAKKAARHLPRYMQDVAFSKAGKKRAIGTFGAASEVRRVDPASYKPDDPEDDFDLIERVDE